jgi:hypothetical protein
MELHNGKEVVKTSVKIQLTFLYYMNMKLYHPCGKSNKNDIKVKIQNRFEKVKIPLFLTSVRFVYFFHSKMRLRLRTRIDAYLT